MKMLKKDLLDDIQKLKMEIEKVMAEVHDFESTEEKEEIHLQTLKAFVDLHEFSDLNLAVPVEFPLHNPNVKDKTPLERFISMNRGINNGGDLPNELLTVRHNSQSERPHRVKTWKRRWFILTDNCLYYFEFTTDKEPRGIIPLENLISSFSVIDDCSCLSLCVPQYCLELYNPNSRGQKIKACKTETDGRVVEGKHQASITKDPFYDLVSVRKKKVINQAPQD
ncbi:unnamed protein product, partial [Coregonus sp. 'balchen']